jgi:divalent metal cation (Fe/Co/Zn/Cd) transporter
MTESTATEQRERVKYGGPSMVVAIVFGLLYAYILWSAIGNLIELPKQLAASAPWALLVLDVALPVIAYAAAFWLGRRRPLSGRALLFFVGLTLLACATVGSIAFVQTH